MMSSVSTNPSQAPLRLCLYVAGQSPNSELARHNLAQLLQDYAGEVLLEIIDVFVQPESQLKAGVLATPTLMKLSPPPHRTIIGNLCDHAVVREALGLGQGSHVRG